MHALKGIFHVCDRWGGKTVKLFRTFRETPYAVYSVSIYCPLLISLSKPSMIYLKNRFFNKMIVKSRHSFKSDTSKRNIVFPQLRKTISSLTENSMGAKNKFSIKISVQNKRLNVFFLICNVLLVITEKKYSHLTCDF